MDKNFLNWLAGFIDGEGYFGIVKQKKQRGALGYYYVPQFMIKLRHDDMYILKEIYKVIGIGKVFEMNYQPPLNKQVKFQITSCPQSLKLIEILDEYPLRAKKKRDYEIWKKAVIYLSENSTNSTKVNQYFLDLVVDLSTVKRYSTKG